MDRLADPHSGEADGGIQIGVVVGIDATVGCLRSLLSRVEGR
jgi:hypothetical protein